jgi:hypothetical protein
MTPKGFYRRAAVVPVVLPLLAAAYLLLRAAAASPPSESGRKAEDVAGFLAIAGAFSLVPYGIFVALVITTFRPTTEREFRRLSWLAPSWIAGPFAIAVGVIVLPGAGPMTALRLGTLCGILALTTGYFYAGLINAAFVAAKRIGWIAPRTER